MFSALSEREPGLVEMIVLAVPARPLAQLAASTRWLRELALVCAEKRVCQLMLSCRHVSRWRRTAYSDGDVLRELYHIECAAAYPARVAGRYRLSSEVMLDLSPTGDFVNYSTGSAEGPGHCFRGVMTVAGVTATPDHDDFLFLLDRWYIACWQEGREVPCELMSFLAPGYQCYSVSALQQGEGNPTPTLYENRPGPDPDRAWRVPSSDAVKWRRVRAA